MEESKLQDLQKYICLHLAYGELDCVFDYDLMKEDKSEWYEYFMGGDTDVVDKNEKYNIDAVSVCMNGIHCGCMDQNEGFLEFKYVRPLLRPLDSITEEERNEISKRIRNACSGNSPYGQIKESGVDNLLFSTIIGSNVLEEYLIANDFDIFGLIGSGLAVDKTKQER